MTGCGPISPVVPWWMGGPPGHTGAEVQSCFQPAGEEGQSQSQLQLGGRGSPPNTPQQDQLEILTLSMNCLQKGSQARYTLGRWEVWTHRIHESLGADVSASRQPGRGEGRTFVYSGDTPTRAQPPKAWQLPLGWALVTSEPVLQANYHVCHREEDDKAAGFGADKREFVILSDSSASSPRARLSPRLSLSFGAKHLMV